jgi:hypothetical protein
MMEGYIVYNSFYYANEYIKQIENTLGVVVWDEKQYENKREGKLLQTNGKRVLDKE